MKLFLSPHNDDEALFGAFTLLREQPLVVLVTDSWVQWNRGDGITAEQRFQESLLACEVLGVVPLRLGLRDDTLTAGGIKQAISDRLTLDHVTHVYAPALQHGHPHHDLVHQVAAALFKPQQLSLYCTYSSASRFYANCGQQAIRGTAAEHAKKALALKCYPSQQARSWRHFEAVKGHPEWLSSL